MKTIDLDEKILKSKEAFLEGLKEIKRDAVLIMLSSFGPIPEQAIDLSDDTLKDVLYDFLSSLAKAVLEHEKTCKDCGGDHASAEHKSPTLNPNLN